MAMVRKQVYILPAQEALLKRRALELGTTEAELIRRGLELAGREGGRRSPFDPQAWAEEEAFIEERVRQQSADVKVLRSWSREDLYEDRRARLSH